MKEKEKRIAYLTSKVQDYEAVIDQLRKHEKAQTSDTLDNAVMKVADLKLELEDAENEKQKELRHMQEAKQWIQIASEPVIIKHVHAISVQYA